MGTLRSNPPTLTNLSTPLHACVNVGCMLQYKGVTQAFPHVTVIYDHLGARGARSGQQLCDSVGGAGKLPDLNVGRRTR